MRLHTVKKEMLGILEALCDQLETFVDLVLLFLKAFDVLSNLVDTNLKPVVLSILIVHRQQPLVVLLEIILPFLVEQLVLSDLNPVS